MRKYDVIIIGGGPSGSALGRLLAARGVSVLIADKEHFPRDKPCGGLITPSCALAAADIFGEGLIPAVARAASCGCRLYRGREFVAEGAIGTPMFFVDRGEMDLSLLSLARQAGCDVREGSRVVEVHAGSSMVRLPCGEEIRGSVIVGADGAGSLVSRAVWHTHRGRQANTGMGFVTELPLAAIKDAELRDACATTPHIFFGVASWGYAWILPKGEAVNVGVGGLLRKNPAMVQCFRDFVAMHCGPESAATLVPKGRPVPYGSFEKLPGRANVLLVGDAAGLADPVTGEGIGGAFQSARLASQAILTSLEGGEPTESGGLYCSAVRDVLHRDLRRSLTARLLLFPKPCLPVALRALRRHPVLVEEFLRTLSGEGDYWRLARVLAASVLR